MKIRYRFLPVAVLGLAFAPGAAFASFALDTGTPTATGMPLTLDGNDYYAAQFALGPNATVTGIQAYVTAGLDQPGDTFTLAIYQDSQGFLGSNGASAVFSGQATYTADGWNGLTNLNWTPGTPGLYWAAVEVGASDSAIGLALPSPTSGGTAPALAFAYNSGGGYGTAGALPFGIQVTSVPLPPAAWLFGSGLLALAGLARRRKAA